MAPLSFSPAHHMDLATDMQNVTPLGEPGFAHTRPWCCSAISYHINILNWIRSKTDSPQNIRHVGWVYIIIDHNDVSTDLNTAALR